MPSAPFVAEETANPKFSYTRNAMFTTALKKLFPSLMEAVDTSCLQNLKSDGSSCSFTLNFKNQEGLNDVMFHTLGLHHPATVHLHLRAIDANNLSVTIEHAPGTSAELLEILIWDICDKVKAVSRN